MMEKFVTIIVVVAILSGAHCSPLRPHVVIILVDDLGWSDVGFHNISAIKTPNIDKLAYDGVILQNYYVQPICTPTRSALMSGKYPIHTGMQHGVIKPEEPYGLPPDLTILPQQLKQAGYTTHIVGKWHLGYFKWEYTPTYRGFDSFYGYYMGAEDHWTHKRMGIVDLHDQKQPVKNMSGVYSAHLFSQEAERIIAQHNKASPLFLYLPFQNVHGPLQAPKRFVDKYKFITNKKRRTYSGMMSAVDEAIGNITKALKIKGLWNNTLIIFTTDNGGIPTVGGYNWPLRGKKSTLWEGGVKGAAFVHGEMLKKNKRICKELIHVTDWYPTLMSLAGLPAPVGLDGVNVWNALSQDDPSPRTEILHNIDLPHTSEQVGSGYQGIALRVGDMKILVNVKNSTWFKPPELGVKRVRSKRRKTIVNLALYNITADPYERHDLSAKLPNVVSRLQDRVQFYMNSVVPSRKVPPDNQAKASAKRNGFWGPWRNSNK